MKNGASKVSFGVAEWIAIAALIVTVAGGAATSIVTWARVEERLTGHVDQTPIHQSPERKKQIIRAEIELSHREYRAILDTLAKVIEIHVQSRGHSSSEQRLDVVEREVAVLRERFRNK